MKCRSYNVTLCIEIEGAEPEELVEEAITTCIEEAVAAGGMRCGVRFCGVADVCAERQVELR